MIDWDLRRLRMLREVEERGTLSAVATALDHSPSSVSQQLAVLEKEVGARLLEKAGRGVRLTDAGRLLARHARVLLAAAEAASADLAALGGEVRGTVRAVGMQSAARRLLVPAVARMMADHPRARAEIAEIEFEQAVPGLRLGAVDLAISDEYDGHPRPRPAGLTFTVLHDEPLRLVLPHGHPAAGRPGPVALSALRDAIWVSSDPGTGHHDMVVGSCRAYGGYEPDVRHRTNDADLQLELVRMTGAVALLPALTLPATDPALAVHDIAEQELRRRLVTVRRDGPAAPVLVAFTAILNDLAGNALRDSPGRERW